eukprot:scaffold17332_cov75-Phaeocystis_antarctica.AAC.4
MLYCHEYCKAVLCIVMSKRIVYIVEVRLKFEVIVSFCVKRETTPLFHNVGHIALRAHKSPKACSMASGSSII